MDIEQIVFDYIKELFNQIYMYRGYIYLGLYVYFGIFIVCLYFILRKANYKGWLAIIPFANLYCYFEIIKVEWYYAYIPILNVIVMFLSPYLLGYQFNQKKPIRALGIFFPLFFFPYIAFSNAQYIHPAPPSLKLKTVNDIDVLEKEIIAAVEKEESGSKIVYEKKQVKNPKPEKTAKSKELEMVDNIDTQFQNIAQFDEDIEDVMPTAVVTQKTEEIIPPEELEEGLEDSDIIENIAEIEKIEKEGIEKGKDKQIDTNDYKELEQEQKSDEKIAFNQEKQTELTCPRCGSSLIGATTTCPGCGIDIRSILYTK